MAATQSRRGNWCTWSVGLCPPSTLCESRCRCEACITSSEEPPLFNFQQLLGRLPKQDRLQDNPRHIAHVEELVIWLLETNMSLRICRDFDATARRSFTNRSGLTYPCDSVFLALVDRRRTWTAGNNKAAVVLICNHSPCLIPNALTVGGHINVHLFLEGGKHRFMHRSGVLTISRISSCFRLFVSLLRELSIDPIAHYDTLFLH